MINVSGMKEKRESGFTITELVIATAVFAGVLLLIIVGFVQIGRLFYKGVAVSQTRQTATNIVNAISADIRLAGNVNPNLNYLCNPNCNFANPLTAYCIGNHLYVANVYSQPVNLDPSSHDFSSNFGLIQSQSGGVCSGGTGANGAYQSSDLVKPLEMLGDDMRLTQFKIEPGAQADTYDIKVTVAYGEDNVFQNFGDDVPSCRGIATGSQFCAVVPISQSVSNRPSFH